MHMEVTYIFQKVIWSLERKEVGGHIKEENEYPKDFLSSRFARL